MNNIELVNYCKAQIGRPYWFGTFGQIANGKIWSSNANRYAKYYSDARKAKAVERGDMGQKVHDCSGLIKGAIMSKFAADMPAIYDAKYDLNAKAFYDQAPEKGDISTIPDLIGLGVVNETRSHIGVYTGNGRVIQAKGFDYGVVESGLDGFTHWCKLPFFDYVSTAPIGGDTSEQPVEAPKKPLEVIVTEVINGAWGNGEERKQRLTAAGYNYDEVQAAVNEQLKASKPQTVYTVKRGDTLWAIASKYLGDGKRYKEIMNLNGLTSDIIRVGQKLILPL